MSHKFKSVCFATSCLCALIMLGSVCVAQEGNERKGIFGTTPRTYEQAFEETFGWCLHRYGGEGVGDKALAAATAREYLKYNWRAAPARVVADAAERWLLDPKGGNPGALVIKQRLKELQPEGEVYAKIEIVDEETLGAMPSHKYTEEQKAQRVDEVRQGLLRDELLAHAVEHSSYVGMTEQEKRQAPDWLKKNLIIRIDFEPTHELITVALDDPPRGGMVFLDSLVSAYESTQVAQCGITGILKSAAEEDDPRRRQRLEQIAALRAGWMRTRYGFEPETVNPHWEFLRLQDPSQIYYELITARAQRDLGDKFGRAVSEAREQIRVIEEKSAKVAQQYEKQANAPARR